ncbi:MAG: hypothetical protein V1492_01005 [Candidatus Micrarchaeota archaeon]
MLSGWLGIFKEEMKTKEPEEKPEEKKAAPSFNEFLKSSETQSFVKEWSTKIESETGKPMYTKAGVTELLRVLHQGGNFASGKALRNSAGEILGLLRGGDKLKGFLAGWKAKSEGLMKGIKSMLKAA